MQIDIERSVNVPLGRNAKFGTLQVDTAKFTLETHDYIYSDGLRQVLNDAMATKVDDDGKALSDDEIRAKAVKRLDNLYAGTLRARGMGDAEPVDPFEAECYKLVIADLTARYRKADKMKGLPKGTKDQLMFVVNRDRATKGLEAITRAEAVEKYMAGPLGPKVAKVAKENLTRREEQGDDILAAGGLL